LNDKIECNLALVIRIPFNEIDSLIDFINENDWFIPYHKASGYRFQIREVIPPSGLSKGVSFEE